MKKLFAVSLGLLLFLGGCYCGNPDPYFDIWGIDVYNGGNYYANQSKDSVRFEEYRIDLRFKAKYYSRANEPGFSLIPEAMATQPCDEAGYKGTKERMANIEIIAVSDYNTNYKKGDLLNPIVTINGLAEPAFFNMQEQSGLSNFGLNLQLTEQPDSTVKQAFKINLKLTNGEAYSAETLPVTIF